MKYPRNEGFNHSIQIITAACQLTPTIVAGSVPKCTESLDENFDEGRGQYLLLHTIICCSRAARDVYFSQEP